MVWSNELVTEVILPSDAIPGPGSGSFVIVGPDNLPPELATYHNPGSQITSAIIWYSTASNLAASHVAYQFLAYMSTNSGTFMQILQGYTTDTLTVIVQQQWGGRFSLGSPFGALLYNAQSFQWQAAGGGTAQNTQLQLGTSIYSLAVAQNANPNQAGSYAGSYVANRVMYNSFIASDGSTQGQAVLAIDGTLQTATLTVPSDPNLDTLLGPITDTGTAGGQSYTSTTYYRVSVDRIVEFWNNTVFAANPTFTASVLTVNLNTSIPAPFVPSGFRTILAGVITNSTTPIQILLGNSPIKIQFIVAAANLPVTYTNFSAHGTYQIAKPSL